MHGPGYAPQPPDPFPAPVPTQAHAHAPAPARPPALATLIALRVVFVVLAMGSLGLLAWGTVLRVAILRGRRLDWALFWITLVLAVVSLVVIGEFSTAGEEPAPQSKATPLDMVMVGCLVVVAIGVPVYFLLADIRHFQRPTGAGPFPYAPYAVPPSPGPLAATALLTNPLPPPPSVPPVPPQGFGPPTAYGYPPPLATPPPEKPRIDQVRAELDELSDYLRRERDR
ncbi:hypothetical protein ACFVIM_19250 [Streptomyces sp. NPDC057638]|uniref:hypothetical protein n=1 Tax=Streptomyces sp. NPDC057638 TaxID=3346190 RepID=UPI00368C80A3